MTKLVFAALALLGGCAAPLADPAPQACELHKAAEIALRLEGGFVVAPAQIDGKPVTMVVDTGAEGLMVTPSAEASLALSADPHRRTTIHGTGGTIVTQNAALQSFAVGGMEMLDESAAVGPLPVLRGPSLHASGLLGAEWLSDFDVELDLPHQRMALYRVSGCHGNYVPWDGKMSSARLQIFASGLPLVPVLLDGHALVALLDSGAAASTLGQAAATEMGGVPPAQGRVGQSMGVDGQVREAYAHRFARLEVAGTQTEPMPLQVSPLSTPMVDMLLGVDWLRRNRVWISYSGRRLTVQPASAL